MPGEPILGKHPRSPSGKQERRSMTWRLFLELRAHAKTIAIHHGYPVYLVGSALKKARPRDIDMAVIMPLPDFEERFGELPCQGPGTPEYAAYLQRVREATIDHYITTQ